MTTKQIESIRKKALASYNKVYKTKVYQYWIDASGHLCRARIADLDTMAMYENGAIEILD